MSLLFRWLLNALGLLLIANIIPGIGVQGFYYALLLVVILGLVNAVLGNLLKLLTLPLTIITLGLSNLFINALLFWFVSTIVKGFTIADWWAAFFGALLYTIISTTTAWLSREN